MPNQESKLVLAKGGMPVAVTGKSQCRFDAEKISGIVEGSLSPSEAFEALHAFFPEFEEERLKKQCEFILVHVRKYKAGTDNVFGGRYFKKKRKPVALWAAMFACVTLLATVVGVWIGTFITRLLICESMTSAGAAAGVCGTMALSGAVIGAVRQKL